MIRNIAAYHFVPVEAPQVLRDQLFSHAESLSLRGTILVAGEGINLFLAGAPADIDAFVAGLRADPRFAEIIVKASDSAEQPFGRLKAKVKPEIISFRMPDAAPIEGRAPAVLPQDLSRWLAQGADDAGRRLVLLDTRNREEFAHGTFAGAETLPIDNFTELPDAVLARCDAWRDATVVSFCTGGIRCEKAALWMRAQGMDNVVQLDGGILGYFEAVGGQGYDGACFVFDGRVALDPSLAPVAAPSAPSVPENPVHA
ncbi:sulfurtransferase [Lysobacter brunescens]|uniref:Sulfurtransferase n=1 Tax=Lysobacter brunescens TaxID=262323 RepID=A0ABW2YDK6_9GAMM